MTITNTTALHHPHINHYYSSKNSLPTIRASLNDLNRRKLVTAFLGTSLALGLGMAVQGTPVALAENWGTRSFLRERFFEPGLSPEDATARIKQTAQGLHSIRDMLETMSWRYVLFYIRLKWAYLSQDMKNAMSMVPKNLRKDYVKTANELVDNMAVFDSYIATPKVYESYLYYEKTLKSLDELVTFLPS
ncbi:photosynthetic NDH subunit of lumenal location 2, chloroplastic [Tripterygium wilfordii]|uniref:photosynthetic NDH subunit of lumenal location 2, chloroplastic n=1 Tax=Tripterygium wilfordii TaxID=458696 RepID=UPI0018F8548F|nr:photosynthetic NDH subunit of lumenal location 2, chloroplastic [Tripterygium wilfordii]